jgi:transposase-like protein
MARQGYPAEFRRRVLELIGSGRKIADVAVDLGISEQTIYSWRRQDERSWSQLASASVSSRPSWPCIVGRRSC